jgi:hypothetical protein
MCSAGIRKALRKEKNRSKKRNEKARGKARFSGSKVEGDTSAVQLRGAGTKLIATQITEVLQPNSAENSALALMTESEKTAYENSAVALSSEEKDALSEIQDALKTFRGRVAVRSRSSISLHFRPVRRRRCYSTIEIGVLYVAAGLQGE